MTNMRIVLKIVIDRPWTEVQRRELMARIKDMLAAACDEGILNLRNWEEADQCPRRDDFEAGAMNPAVPRDRRLTRI